MKFNQGCLVFCLLIAASCGIEGQRDKNPTGRFANSALAVDISSNRVTLGEEITITSTGDIGDIDCEIQSITGFYLGSIQYEGSTRFATIHLPEISDPDFIHVTATVQKTSARSCVIAFPPDFPTLCNTSFNSVLLNQIFSHASLLPERYDFSNTLMCDPDRLSRMRTREDHRFMESLFDPYSGGSDFVLNELPVTIINVFPLESVFHQPSIGYDFFPRITKSSTGEVLITPRLILDLYQSFVQDTPDQD